MNDCDPLARRPPWPLVGVLAIELALAVTALPAADGPAPRGQISPANARRQPPKSSSRRNIQLIAGTEPPEPGAITNGDQPDDRGTSIDLPTALRLAGVENLDLVLARQRVEEAVAIQQYAAAQILPNVNLGMNYDAHTGNLQQSSGNILNLQRSALYVGAGANAVAAGTVSIPGLQWNLNVSESIYNYFVSQ